jgi:hypothetical protein
MIIMGIAGTWWRDGIMNYASEDGTKLTIEGSLNGLNLRIFLLLTSPGVVYRRRERDSECRKWRAFVSQFAGHSCASSKIRFWSSTG